MPFFFAISGYLYRTKGSIFDNFKKKIRTLYLPYVGCSFIMQVIGWLFWEPFSVKKAVKILIMMDFGPLLGATWFIAVLFFSILIYDVINRIVTKLKISEYFITGFCVICLAVGLFVHLPVRANNTLLAISFVHCGKIINKYQSFLFLKNKIKRRLLWCSSAAIVLVISFFSTSSFATNTFSSKWCFLIAAISGTVFLMVFSFDFSEFVKVKIVSNHMRFIGSNTMGIVIWQFVSFKIVSLLQIWIYALPIERVADYPIIYDYSFGVWIVILLLSGIYVSIFIHFLLSILPNIFIKKLKTYNKKRS